MTKQSKLDSLKKDMQKANLPLKKTATTLVFGAGRPDAQIVFVGEAPGKNEDLNGLPFVGSAGKVLDSLLDSIGLERRDAYITSILKYRPPKNRNPQLDEIVHHTPYLIDQIRIIDPRIIVPMGNFAARFILSGFNVAQMSKVPAISQLHGKIQKVSFEKKTYSVIAMYHPAAVLYNSSLRKILEKDFKIIKKFLSQADALSK